MKNCKIVFDDIPSFDDVWESVKLTDRWQALIHDECRRQSGTNDYDDVVWWKKCAIVTKEELARDFYDSIVSHIKWMFRGEYADIYRSIYIDDVDGVIGQIRDHGKIYHGSELKGVGIYWAWDLDHAKGYDAEKGYEIILVAVASCRDIDTFKMIKNFMHFAPNPEIGDWVNENEVTIKPGKEILLRYVLKAKKFVEKGNKKCSVAGELERVDMNVKIWT